eukprot:s1342_g1.t2
MFYIEFVHLASTRREASTVAGAPVGTWWRTTGPLFNTYMYEDVANSQPTIMMRRKLIRLGQCHVIERCDGSGEAYTISEGSNYFANRFRKWLGMTQAMSYKIYKGDTLIAVAEETQNGFESIAFRNISSRKELASSVLEGRHFHGQYDLWLVDAKKKDADLPAYVSSAATLLYAFFVMHQRGHKIKVDPNGPEGHGGHDGPSFLAATVENVTVANVPSEIVGSGEGNGAGFYSRVEVFACLIHAGPSASRVRTWPPSWRLVSAMAVKARHRGPRPAALLLVAPILLLSWACGWNLSFALGVSPRSRPTPQTGGARMHFPDAEAASSSTASFLAVGGLAAAVTMASASKRAKLVGRKAEEVEDWSLESVSKKFAPQVAEIRKLCKDLPEDFDDTKLLRYALQHPDAPGDAAANVKEVLEWRQGEGAGIVKAAADAIAKGRGVLNNYHIGADFLPWLLERIRCFSCFLPWHRVILDSANWQQPERAQSEDAQQRPSVTCRGSPARCRLEEGSCPLHDMELDSSTLVVPGGQSRCIFSNAASEYAFQVIPGDADKLLIFFQGGGACFNDASTQGAAPCLSHVVEQPLVGIFDRTNAANSYRKYTVVHINYCSGDLHIGNVVRWYLDGAGQRVEQLGFLNALSAIKWTRTMVPADIFHQLAAAYPHVALPVITSQQDAMQIKIYNAVCMANMMTERDSAAEWESKLIATLESYNKHPGFVLYLMSGNSDYFLPVKELFTTDLRGKHGLPSYGLKLAQEGGGWDNKPVLDAAPHAAKVSKYITPSQMVVVSTKVGDLVTCIRASTIDSEALMKEVTEEEMTEFFIYAREVNSAMAEFRTRNTGHVCRLISANDLTGVSKFPDQSFQNALTGSAKRAVTLYPGYSGPTVLLNLPWLARMLVSILTPLFPGAVREKIKFARGPMAYMKDLEDVIKEPTRGMFVDDLQAVLNS